MEAICKLKDIYKALYEFENDFQSRYQITINEGIIMCQLSEGAKRAGEICADCGISTTRLSKVLKGMEEKGLIERTLSMEDRRVVVVSLTGQGKEKVARMKGEQICIPEYLSVLISKN